MVQWDSQNRAVSDKQEFRVFHDPASSRSRDRTWILVIREVGEDGVHTHVFHESYSHGRRSEESRSAMEGAATEVTGRWVG
jgi:hypothetical protein